jgi:enoyl-CoA hydratase
MLETHQEVLEKCLSVPTLAQAIALLEAQQNPMAESTLQMLQKRSPLSLRVVYEQLRRGRTMTFAQGMRMEFDLSQNFLRQPDFFEGIRCVIIDKDQRPHWRYAHLADVPEMVVEGLFAPHPQKLALDM